MLSPICNSQAKPGQFPYEQSSNERNERTKWNKNRGVYWLNGRTLMANECTDYDKYMACSITKWIDCMLTIRTYDVGRCIYNQISEFHQSAVRVVSVGCDFLHSPSTWVDHLIYLHDRLDGCVYSTPNCPRMISDRLSTKTTQIDCFWLIAFHLVRISMEIRIRSEWILHSNMNKTFLALQIHSIYVHAHFMLPNASYIKSTLHTMFVDTHKFIILKMTLA